MRSISYVGDEDFDHLKGTRETRWEQIPGAPVEFDPSDWPDTPGSDKIIEILLQDDPGPVNLQAWGGGNTASRAFYKLKRDHPDDYKRAASKAVLYNIWYQDDAGNYIETNHPEVTMIYCGHFAGSWNYRSQPNTRDFITHNVKTGHGPLGQLYSQSYISEGDSPAFFYSLPNGLRNYEQPGFGGWGGRFRKVDGFERVFKDAEDAGGKRYQLKRWVDDVNRDFEARMDWCVADTYEKANHAPSVRLGHARDLNAKSGERITLDASVSSDPDGNAITFKWWQYREAGSGDASVTIQTDDKAMTQIELPKVNAPETIHVILEVRDDGSPRLVGYERIVITIKP